MTYKVFFYKFSEQDFLNPSFQNIADKIPNISKDLFYQYINPLNQIQRGILKKYLQEEGFEYVNYILGYSSRSSLNKNAKKEMDEQFNKMITNYNIRLLINSLKKLESISSEIEIEKKTYQEEEFLRDNHHIIYESIDSIGNSCEAISKASSHKTPTAKRKQSDASMEDARAPKITKIIANEQEAIEDTSSAVVEEFSYSSAQAEEETIEDTSSALVEDANASYNIYLYQFDKDYFRNKFFNHLEGLDDNQFEKVKKFFKAGNNFIIYLKEILQARKNNTRYTNSKLDQNTKNAFGTKISHYLNKIKTLEMLVFLRREAIDEGFKKLVDSIGKITPEKFKEWVKEASIEQKNIVIDYLRANGKVAQLDYIFFPPENAIYTDAQRNAIKRIFNDPSIALLIKNFKNIKNEHPSLNNKQIKIVIKKYRDGDDLIAFTLENKDEEDDFYRDIYDVFINNGDGSDLELLDDNFFQSKTDDLDYQETSDFGKEDGSCSDLDPETENLKEIISSAQTEVEIADSENMMEVVPSRQESIVESLFKAIDHGDTNKVESLISNNPDLINAVNRAGNSAVFMSMSYGHTDITNLLTANGFSMSEDEFSSHQRICAQYDNSEELCPYADENFILSQRGLDSDLIPHSQFEDPLLWGQDNLSNQNEQPNVPEAADPSLEANLMILGGCIIASNIMHKHP